MLFRHDLRVADNAALVTAAKSGKPVLPVFVLDEESTGLRPLGGARRWWLHHSLSSLAKDIETLGANLVLRRGQGNEVVQALVEETGADLVLWNRRYEPAAIEVDKATKEWLGKRGVHAESFEGQLLHEPWRLQTASGGPYRVFTPFWRALASQIEPGAPLKAPKSLRGYDRRRRNRDVGRLEAAADDT